MKRLWLLQVMICCSCSLSFGSGAAEAEGESGVAARKSTHWAFVPRREPEPPGVQAEAWVRNDIDRFILARLEENNLAPAPEADPEKLVRRLYFDVIGLPPTPEEVQSFVESSSATVVEDLVERLLDHPGYGERWGRYWLDLARYSDSLGFEGDPEIAHTWRYRDYVIDAFNHDKPYDQFIIEQLAGDELNPVTSAVRPPGPNPEQVVALTFLRLAPFKRTPLSEENRDVLLSEMTGTVGSVFLALTLECAKCHDHKYDDIPQEDFYRMQAFFANVLIPTRAEEWGGKGGPKDLMGGTLPAAFYRPGEKEKMEAARMRCQAELDAAQAALAELKPAAEKDEQPTEPEDEARIGELQATSQRLERHLERLEPVAFSVENAVGPPLGPALPTTYVLIRGNYDKPGKPVAPGFPSTIVGHANPADLKIDRFSMLPGRGWRLALARWITDPANPLTARVMVNRIWQHHFGRGIVETPSNFGVNGQSPSHPELLDWLANRFVAEKWSIKAIHRLILNSSSYRQTCTNGDPLLAEKDPKNRFFSRFTRQRLEGEIVRDAILAVSGRLNREGNGPPVFPPIPDDVRQANKRVRWDTSSELDCRRRSIYVHQRRMLNLPFLKIFDAPVLNTTCSRRKASVTVLQSLAMYDSEFVNGEANAFADRVIRESGPAIDDQVRYAFRLAFCRQPEDAELERATAFMQTQGPQEESLVRLCRVLYNSSEFLYID